MKIMILDGEFFFSHLNVVCILSMIESFPFCIECKRDWEKSRKFIFCFPFDEVAVTGNSGTGCG